MNRCVDPAINPVSVVCDVSRMIVFEAFIETWYSDTETGVDISSVRIQPTSQFCIWSVAVASWATAVGVKSGIIVAAKIIMIIVGYVLFIMVIPLLLIGSQVGS